MKTRARAPALVVTAAIAGLLSPIVPASAASPAVPTRAPISATPITGLHVEGRRLVDEAGHAVILRGVNRIGTEYMCAQDRGITDGPQGDASVAAIKSWGTNAVRIPLNEHCWLGVDDGAPTPDYVGEPYRAAIETIVQLLLANGLYPILDLHWSAPAGQAAVGLRPMPNTSYSAEFWTSVATRFKDDTRVIFDLYNEPVPNNNASDATEEAARRSWECWRDGGTASCDATLDLGSESTRMTSAEAVGMSTLVDAVRATGAANVIMLGGIQWANTLWSSASHNWLTYLPAAADNLVAAVHLYPAAWCVDIACFDAEIANLSESVPVVATEFGYAGCDAAAASWLNGLMSWSDAKSIGYLAWAWITAQSEEDACSGGKLVASFDGAPTAYGEIYRAHLAGLPVETATRVTPSPAGVSEGQSVTLTAEVSTPDRDTVGGSVVFVVDGVDLATAGLDTAGRSAIVTSFSDDGVHAVAARYLGAGVFQPSASGTLSLGIVNAAPSVGQLTGPRGPLAIGAPAVLGAAFTDPGAADTHTVTVDWGDGTTSPSSVSEANGSGTFTASNAYSAAGFFAPVATVRDDDGGSVQSAPASVIVFDPTRAVSGAGWIEPPPGAAPSAPAASGRASFSFSASYESGAAVPTGKLSFTVREAGLALDAARYQWLVITGVRAQLAGAGRVNGADGYAFLLSVSDGRTSGGQDALRMKIWNAASGQVVYDNQPGAADREPPLGVVGGGDVAVRGGA